MFKKYIFKKIKVVILTVLILNLGLGSLLLAPTQAQAINPQTVFDAISNLNDGAELAEISQNELINMIEEGEQIPEEFKPYVISSILNADDLPKNTQNLLMDFIQTNRAIPEDLKSLIISAINGNENVTGLIKNWALDLLLKHVDIEYICKSLSDAAANVMVFGTTVGTPVAIAITQLCPIILNEMLQAFLQTLPEPPAPANIQTIQYPIFESYQWEIGIPGFTSPGEITPFK